MVDEEKDTSFSVHTIPCWKDNYAYLIIDDDTLSAVGIDTVEPKKILNKIKDLNDASNSEKKIALTHIFTTHHHKDHSSGNLKMKELVKDIEIIGGKIDNVEACTKNVQDGDIVKVGNLNFKCLHTAGHTNGHICYYVEKGGKSAVFTGDTVFQTGAGYFFEGTGADMSKSFDKIIELPEETLLYPGHEYTVNNCKYALSIDGDNEVLKKQFKIYYEQRKNEEFTVPSTVGLEKKINPFMRCHTKFMQDKFDSKDPEVVMTRVREDKNKFASNEFDIKSYI